MKPLRKLYQTVFLLVIYHNAAVAQITSDFTVGTTVTPDVLINGTLSDRISGGTIEGNNLFHSFSKFNINVGRGVYFTNPVDVTNIFTRVTGSNPSHINGTLGVLGNANLFFMNPNGIVFGTEARLDLKGSFLGTSAMSIDFADGTQFSAEKKQTIPLLSVSVPMGLGFGSTPGMSAGVITVNGTGHKLTTTNPDFAPYINRGGISGLQLQAGKTLALVGGQVNLNGGILTAPQGRVELGSVSEGTVTIASTTNGFRLGYDAALLGDISLQERSLVDVSGMGAGSIQVNGRSVSLRDGSIIWMQNRGIQQAGDINIIASESLELNGVSLDGEIRSGIGNETLGGTGGNVNIATKRLIIQNGGAIGNRTFSSAPGGNISLNATESIEVSGFSTINPLVVSAIGSITLADGKSGDISVSTPQLSVLNGATIAATTFGSGDGGNISINAQTVEVKGIGLGLFVSSTIASSTFGRGDAGSIDINTRNAMIEGGANVNTVSLNDGNAGSITLNATESVQLAGKSVDGTYNSILESSVFPNLDLQNVFELPALPKGDAGNVTINTPFLLVGDEASLSVNNQAAGNAGTLMVNADSIKIDNLASLSAFTAIGEGGDIVVQAQNLQMRRHSNITATAGGMGNGGSITINTDTLTQLENSDITANAVEGRGGNINVTTLGLFHSPDSDITASSELGINGIVNISNLRINQENELVEQPSQFVSTDSVVASSCLANRNQSQGKFVMTGNGGLPETPDSVLIPYSVAQVQSVTTPQTQVNLEQVNSVTQPWKLGEPIVEAKQLALTTEGHLVLTSVANETAISKAQNVTCE